MKFPLVVSGNGTLMIAPSDFFTKIGKLDFADSTLEINVTSKGTAGLNWFLDANGDFYDLALLGSVPPSLLQRLGVLRAREKFRIAAARKISVQELTDRISGLTDRFEEAPNVSDLKTLLSSSSPDQLLTPQVMSRYLGE